MSNTDPIGTQGATKIGDLQVAFEGDDSFANRLKDLVSTKAAAERVMKEDLNVRQTEQLVAKLANRGAGVVTSPTKTQLVVTDTHVADLESKLREAFGTKVQLRYAAGKGSVEISFYSDAELERILQLLGVSNS